MAETENEKNPQEEKEKSNAAPARTVKSSAPWPLIIVGVVATMTIVAVVIIGWLWLIRKEDTPSRMGSMRSSAYERQSESPRNGFGGYSGSGPRGMRGAFAANGVITAINGDTLTVSGQGKQVTVTKSATTVIGGDKDSVAVNDTVLVSGTTGSDGTVSATRIIVHNGNGMMSSGQDSGTTDPDA